MGLKESKIYIFRRQFPGKMKFEFTTFRCDKPGYFGFGGNFGQPSLVGEKTV